MAGSYNDAPSRRMAWDADGSVGLHSEHDSNGTGPSAGGFGSVPWSNATSGERIGGNDENPASYFRSISVAGAADGHVMMAILFPELRELDGIYINYVSNGSSNRWMYYSSDTTQGVDGSWSNTGAAFNTSSSLDHYRDNITSMVFPTVKGIKGNLGETSIGGTSRWRTIHIYGRISAGETPDRILFLNTEDSDQEFTKVLDFGDKPRGQTTTRTFKLKNNSSTKTINTIQITAEDLYLNAGDWYTFGDDGVAYQATHDIGNLGPGSTELVYLKQIIPDAETLGVQAARIKVSHASVT